MTSVSNGEIRAAIRYSSSLGSTTQVIVRWRSFTLGTFSGGNQSVTINTELNVNAQGGSSGGEQSTQREVSIWLNGVQVANRADAFGSNTYTCIGRVNNIRVSLSASGRSHIAAGGSKTDYVRPNFDYTISLIDINPTADFIFVNPENSRFVQLPPVNLNPGRLIYFKLRGNIATNDLGGDQYQGRSIWINTYNGDSQIRDVGSSAIYINQNYGCLTLFSDGVTWYVANYYPSPIQGSLASAGTTTFTGGKISTAVINTVNNFSTNSSAARKSGDNLINLPTLSGRPAMCIVVYSGDATCTRSWGNALLFSHSTLIDGNPAYNSGSSKAYILANESTKNTGIVFISDGTSWFIAGWFNGSNWAVSSSTSGSNTSLGTLSSNLINVLQGTGGGIRYRLPQDLLTSPFLLLVKARPNSTALEFTSRVSSTVGNALINNDTQNMYFNRGTGNTCIWFVRQQIVSGDTRYYPIISYTPSA
jgi:hypothetical protein